MPGSSCSPPFVRDALLEVQAALPGPFVHFQVGQLRCACIPPGRDQIEYLPFD